jgi:hypothetical protein
MGRNGPQGGRSRIEQMMREGFWKKGRPLQSLRYEHVEVCMLGKITRLSPDNLCSQGVSDLIGRVGSLPSGHARKRVGE